MAKLGFAIFVIALVVYIGRMLSPPKDALGSVIPGWDDPYRRRKMIRDESQQDEDFGWFV